MGLKYLHPKLNTSRVWPITFQWAQIKKRIGENIEEKRSERALSRPERVYIRDERAHRSHERAPIKLERVS